MNLHDWVDELCDVLDIEVELDESLVLDLARDAAHNVERVAAPITTYLLGYAAGLADAGPDAVEKLAAKATSLAVHWDGRVPETDDARAVDQIENLQDVDDALVDSD